MRFDLKKLIAVVVLVFLVFTLRKTLASGSSLTKEEAIQISRTSPLVQESFENSDHYDIEVHHINASAPEGHGAWDIMWHIHVRGYPSGAAIGVGQRIDEETGEILREGSLMYR